MRPPIPYPTSNRGNIIEDDVKGIVPRKYRSKNNELNIMKDKGTR